MLYVNQEEVKPGSPAHARFMAFRDGKLKKMKNPVIFKSGLRVTFDANGRPNDPKSETIPYQTTIQGETGSETWVYTPSPPRKVDGNLVFSEKGRMFWHGKKLMLNKSEAELIFFLSELSPLVKKGRIVLEDKEFEARTQISKKVGALDVEWYVYSEHSPLSVESTGGEETLRTIASAWGVPGVEALGISEVKVNLVKYIQRSEANRASTGRGYAEFVSETRVDEYIKLRSIVQRAIDRGAVYLDNGDNTWRFGANQQIIMTVAPRDFSQKETALYNYMRANEGIKNILYTEMGEDVKVLEFVPEIKKDPELTAAVADQGGKATEEVKDSSVDFDNIEKWHYHFMQKVGGKLGYRTWGMNKKKLVDILTQSPKEKLEEAVALI